jgi:hypothetical protein
VGRDAAHTEEETTVTMTIAWGDQTALLQLEADELVIERGKDTFLAVGQALARIRADGTYKARGFATFEQYCKERWGWGRQTAWQYIQAAGAAANVSPGLQPKPALSQARMLAVLPPEEQSSAWQEATARFPNPTKLQVAQVVAERRQVLAAAAPAEQDPARVQAGSYPDQRITLDQWRALDAAGRAAVLATPPTRPCG